MGSVTRSITNFFRGGDSVAETLRKIFTPCLSNADSKKISIKIFDKKSLIGDVTNSVETVRQSLETFFNDLHKTESLPPAVAQNLQSFSFEVAIIGRDSTPDERRAFGMLDFPVYLETTDATQAFTEGDGKDLLLAHQIPEVTQVRLTVSDTENQLAAVHSYDEVKSFVKDDDQKDLGVGIPGTYFGANLQYRCRKVGIIKMNLIKKNLVLEKRQPKFISVMKHELGHMFGMDHEPGTLMDPSNREAINHDVYTRNQVITLNGALTVVSR